MSKPNILMITCHDIGQHLGCYGVETVQTPNLDRLASNGVRFENFYSTSPVCSPARGSLHTGRYPQANGLMGLTHAPWWWKINDKELHTAQILSGNGYETSLIGFNHISRDTGRLGYRHHLSPKCDARETVEAARDLFRKPASDGKPFFAKVGFTQVHRPFKYGSDTKKGVHIPPWLQPTRQIKDDLAEFQAVIKFFDERVGEILEALSTSPVAANTLVVMTADHGMPYPGAKWSVRKAGIEVPLIMYQPQTGFTGGKVFRELVSNVDVLPTLLQCAGCVLPGNLQGFSFLDLVSGRNSRPVRKEAFAQYTPEMKRDNVSRCVITDRYHLIRYFSAGRTVEYPVDVHPQTFANHEQRCKTGGSRPFAQLYDIEKDPGELNDIASREENQGIVKDLSRRLLAWMEEINDPILRGPVRHPYYDRAMADLRNT